MRISRRAVLAYGTLLGFPQILIETAASLAQAGPVRVRQNIERFAQDPQKVKALRDGVGKMKERSRANRDDPRGWDYWSAVHGTNDPVPNPLKGIYAQCEHTQFNFFTGNPIFIAEHFISWHRPFLFFFEVALKQAAQDAGVTTAFELPYWNWYAAGDLPKIFTDPTDPRRNPLWHPRRREAVNSARLERAAFAQKDCASRSRCRSNSIRTVQCTMSSVAIWATSPHLRAIRSSGCTTPTSTGCGRSGPRWAAAARIRRPRRLGRKESLSSTRPVK